MPSTRTCSSHPLQVIPAMPTPLLPSAPSTPETRVPCQELLPAVQLVSALNGATGQVGGGHPVARIRGIGIRAAGFVASRDAADEVIARQQPSTRPGAQQVGMIEAYAGVEIRNHEAGAAGRDVPGIDGIGRARRRCGRIRVRVLQVPLTGGLCARDEQRVIGQHVRMAPLVRLRVLDFRIGTQSGQGLCGRLPGCGVHELDRMQPIEDGVRAPHAQVQASAERQHLRARRADRRRGTAMAEFHDHRDPRRRRRQTLCDGMDRQQAQQRQRQAREGPRLRTYHNPCPFRPMKARLRDRRVTILGTRNARRDRPQGNGAGPSPRGQPQINPGSRRGNQNSS